jgi:hypothetical protein
VIGFGKGQEKQDFNLLNSGQKHTWRQHPEHLNINWETLGSKWNLLVSPTMDEHTHSLQG